MRAATSDDLTNARDRLRRLNPQRLDARERAEFIVGLGEALYFEESAGAAAEVFDSVLDTARASDGRAARERVLDWWASALDREARPRSDIERQAVYQRIRDAHATELGSEPGERGGVLLAGGGGAGAGRSAGRVGRRAGGLGPRAARAPISGAALRGDLDRLVQRRSCPIARGRSAQPPDALRLEWEELQGDGWKQVAPCESSGSTRVPTPAPNARV